MFNNFFPGPLAKGSIGGFRRRLEGELCALLPLRGRASGRSSIARRFGDDSGEAVIVDGVELLQKADEFGCVPLPGIGDALPIGEGDRLGPIECALAVVSPPVKLGWAMARRLAPVVEQRENTGVD